MEKENIYQSLRVKHGLSQHMASENWPAEQVRACLQEQLPQLRYWQHSGRPSPASSEPYDKSKKAEGEGVTS